ncbi:MAG: type I DNA topoisomerase, partial [Patescibacteria group bacterium]
MKLVIVESPTKAKTIGKFLGSEYNVQSSYGHIRDLPKSKLGIDVENNFAPQYIIPTKAKKVVSALKKEAHKCEAVILATDEDREGEAIAWHLAQALELDGLKNKKSKIESVERIVFHEITKRAIDEALSKPRPIDLNLVDAQQARRVLDRIVGYKLSPFLWKKVAGGLSAGRVQSVALRLIVDRENEITAFKPEEYWTVAALLKPKNGEASFEANLAAVGGEPLGKFGIKTGEEANEIADDLRAASYSVTSVEEKSLHKNPPPPFTTSTLQQEGVKRLRYSSKRTMMLAQRLYENGLITYMRTDSTNLSAESTVAASAWLKENLGERYALPSARNFKTKSKLAQEAHEAIRPTDVRITPESISVKEEAERKLYQLIWSRFVASQMPTAEVAATILTVAGKGKKDYVLRAAGQTITFDGFLKIWAQKLEERELPKVKESDPLDLDSIVPAQHFTEPPPRYSEATLVKALEEFGVGRPSTYAPIISVIQYRNYVEKEARRFKPTEIGMLVSKVLTEHFPEVVDVGFTAEMEDELDDVAAGNVKWQSVIQEFYDPFAKHLEEKYEEVKKEKLIPETTNVTCDCEGKDSSEKSKCLHEGPCGKPMVIKMSRFGKFMACSGFPDCRNTKKLAGAGGTPEPPKLTGLKCPKCTEGDVVERRVHRGRARGKIFWGCSRYPACDYATWENPVSPPGEPPKSDS